MFEKSAALFQELQDAICASLEGIDGKQQFREDLWERPGGGGGRSRVLTDGNIFEKAGVNWSGVEGELPEEFAAQIPGEGRKFRATGVSLVLHPKNPYVPTTHANFRFIEKGDTQWFGGGGDLTPYYFFREDAIHFHRCFESTCSEHPTVGDYPAFKKWCDEYFYLPHREETRGIGGVFYDYLKADDTRSLDDIWNFSKSMGHAFLDAYLPIVKKRSSMEYSPAQRQWQLQRRGRYVEFNLLYDRGTVFGLKTNGRTESILMSLPPFVRWDYNVSPTPGSPEAELIENLKPQDWLGLDS